MNKEKASIGMGAMNSYGHLLMPLVTPIQYVEKIITAEVLAIWHALERTLLNGWSNIYILSDAKNVAHMLQKKMTISWE